MPVFGSFLNFYSLCARAVPYLVPFSVTVEPVDCCCQVLGSNKALIHGWGKEGAA